MSTKTKTAKTATKNTVDHSILPDGTPVVFTELRTPVDGELQVQKGVVIYVAGYNEDDKSYNVSHTPNGVMVETLYREEFRLAAEEETKSSATAFKKAKTAAEADSGSSKPKIKDKAGKTVTVKPVKAVKAPKPTPEPLAPVKLYKSVSTFVAESGGLIEAAVALVDRSGKTEITLGAILGKIQETSAHEAIEDADGNPKYGTGFVGFGKFVEEHLGMKYRKALYLIGNYAKLTELGIPEKQVLGIPWTKLVLALSAMTEDNMEEVLAEAKAKPYGEFKAAVKKRIVDGGGTQHGNSKAEQVTFTFKLHNDKALAMQEALAAAKTQLGIEGTDVFANSQAIDLIMSEWMSMKD